MVYSIGDAGIVLRSNSSIIISTFGLEGLGMPNPQHSNSVLSHMCRLQFWTPKLTIINTPPLKLPGLDALVSLRVVKLLPC